LIVKCMMGIFLCIFLMQILQIFSLPSRIMRWLGSYSLYLYLMHSNIYMLMAHFLDMETPIATALYFGVTVIVPFLMKKLVDILIDLVENRICKNK